MKKVVVGSVKNKEKCESVGNIVFISSGTFDRILDVPKMGQKYDPFLYGTLREVGFGKSFAYKHYVSDRFALFLIFNYIETKIYVVADYI